MILFWRRFHTRCGGGYVRPMIAISFSSSLFALVAALLAFRKRVALAAR